MYFKKQSFSTNRVGPAVRPSKLVSLRNIRIVLSIITTQKQCSKQSIFSILTKSKNDRFRHVDCL